MPQISPGWNGLHLFTVHFPIILLLVAPLLVILGIGYSTPKRRVFLGFALTLMVLGTTMTYVAVATGESATKVVAFAPELSALLDEHRRLAETTMEWFSVLTLILAALFFVHRVLEREVDLWITKALFSVFLILYGTGAVLLVDTALKGSQLMRVLGGTAETLVLPNCAK
jgi:uncharacterized membrane protein